MFIRPVCSDSSPVATVEINHMKLAREEGRFGVEGLGSRVFG